MNSDITPTRGPDKSPSQASGQHSPAPVQGPLKSFQRKVTPFWRSKRVLIIVAVIILAMLGWWFFLKQDSVPGSNETKTISVDGTAFAYPGNWRPLVLSDADKKANVIFKLGAVNPTGSFVWRTIKGKLDKDVKISTLPDQIANTLTSGIDGVKIIGKEVSKVGSHEAVRIHYTRPDGSNSKITLGNLMYVVPRANQTDYLTFSTKETDFNKLEPGFGKILESYVSYTTAHP